MNTTIPVIMFKTNKILYDRWYSVSVYHKDKVDPELSHESKDGYNNFLVVVSQLLERMPLEERLEVNPSAQIICTFDLKDKDAGLYPHNIVLIKNPETETESVAKEMKDPLPPKPVTRTRRAPAAPPTPEETKACYEQVKALDPIGLADLAQYPDMQTKIMYQLAMSMKKYKNNEYASFPYQEKPAPTPPLITPANCSSAQKACTIQPTNKKTDLLTKSKSSTNAFNYLLLALSPDENVLKDLQARKINKCSVETCGDVAYQDTFCLAHSRMESLKK